MVRYLPRSQALKNALAAPSMVLQSDLLFAEQRSGTLSIGVSLFLVFFLIPVCLWHQQQQNWPEQQLTHPREKLFPRKGSSFSSPCPRTAAAPSPSQEETQSLQNDSHLLCRRIYREPSPMTVGPRQTNSSACLLPGGQVPSSGKSSRIGSAPLELIKGEN